MAIRAAEPEEFLKLSKKHPIFDVRSPKEYMHAHIPGALTMPLFSDDERAVVGTAYKQESRQNAIKLGLDFFGPKMKAMVETVEDKLNEMNADTVLVHCWRGGMRSGAVAWLLNLYGFNVITLKGGYKAFRNWVLQQLEKPYKIRILGGYTGSGKTLILYELKKRGEAVIDLEALAEHHGSAFGNLGMPEQPSNEEFENELAVELFELTGEGNPVIWLESESSRIGDINISHLFFNQMKAGESIRIDVPMEARLELIMEEYGCFEVQRLTASVKRIERRLGGQNAKKAIEWLEEGNIREAFVLLLEYYDRFYQKSELYKPFDFEIKLPGTNPVTNTDIILETIKNDYAGRED